MNLFMQLLRDEHGFVLSAESMLLGTVGVIGATVGLSAVSKSVNDELTDVAMAFRSVDQSFHIEGASNCGACVAGSSFKQRPVEESLKQLQAEIEKAKSAEQKRLDQSEKDHGDKKKDKAGDSEASSKKEARQEHKKDRDHEKDDDHDKKDDHKDDKQE